MVLQDLKHLVAIGAVGKVFLYKAPDTDATWEIWAFDHDDIAHRGPCAAAGNRLLNVRDREPKFYSSLDRAYKFIRSLGYRGSITIDG